MRQRLSGNRIGFVKSHRGTSVRVSIDLIPTTTERLAEEDKQLRSIGRTLTRRVVFKVRDSTDSASLNLAKLLLS